MAKGKDDGYVNYSVVVPIYNEEGNISAVDKEIKEVMRGLGKFEIIYVNDGSRDRSLIELKKLKNVKIINLQRNYGQSTALDAGFKAAKGSVVISMDGDLQNDAHDIPRLLAKLYDKNLDVVAGWRRNRKDKAGINLLSRTGRVLRRFFIQDYVHDSGCMLRVYRKEAVKSLDLTGEMHRYILALLRWKGFRIGELEVNHRARTSGKTKYGMGKAVRGFIDLIYIWFVQKYSQRPLHIYGYLSIVTFGLAVISAVLAVYDKVINNLSLNRNIWFFASFFFILASIMSFSFGIILHQINKIQYNTSPYEKRYYIRELIEN